MRETIKDRVDEYGRVREIECAGQQFIARHTVRERMIAGRLNVHVRAVIIGNGRKVIKTNSFYR